MRSRRSTRRPWWGADNGAPGERPHYHHPGYYGAFVLDPDGNNIKAVCHEGAVGQKEA
ncbi:hypothetical protein [Actinomyces wuliandei]|uniref:hypothetical protein n=1 Tax=Actinomyces wuliandei TaxID=2057743 RepID=UPI0027D804D1|nr:hypothetical protein [Actinomyces wuliandei]